MFRWKKSRLRPSPYCHMPLSQIKLLVILSRSILKLRHIKLRMRSWMGGAGSASEWQESDDMTIDWIKVEVSISVCCFAAVFYFDDISFSFFIIRLFASSDILSCHRDMSRCCPPSPWSRAESWEMIKTCQTITHSFSIIFFKRMSESRPKPRDITRETFQ